MNEYYTIYLILVSDVYYHLCICTYLSDYPSIYLMIQDMMMLIFNAYLNF